METKAARLEERTAERSLGGYGGACMIRIYIVPSTSDDLYAWKLEEQSSLRRWS